MASLERVNDDRVVQNSFMSIVKQVCLFVYCAALGKNNEVSLEACKLGDPELLRFPMKSV